MDRKCDQMCILLVELFVSVDNVDSYKNCSNNYCNPAWTWKVVQCNNWWSVTVCMSSY